MTNWARILGFGGAGVVATALSWFLLRTYTGIFDILNLRVFVGVIVLLPALGASIYGFDPTILTQNKEHVTIPKAVCGVAAVCGMGAIVLGEFTASLVKGVPIPWERFNLILLGVCLVLPFQFERLFNKK